MTTEVQETHKAIPEMAVETRLLVQALCKLTPDEFLPYSELSRIASCNVQGQGRGYLNTARDRVASDKAIITEAVRGEGIKRIANANIVDVGRAALKSIRNKSRKTGRKLTAVDISVLTNDQRVAHLATASGLAMIAHCADPRSVRRLEPLCAASTLELPVGRVLEAFQSDRTA